MQIKGRRFSVIGIARSGIAAAKKIVELGGEVFLSDNKPADKIDRLNDIKDDFSYETGGHTSRVFLADVIVISPGVPLNIPVLKEAQQKKIEIISEIELGFRIKHPDSKLICCTGSNGKSTTVSLISHLLSCCGYHTVLAGNIGTPFTEFPVEKPGIDFIVLELSSFQLELVDTFKTDVALLLNVTPDHLNRYDSFTDYGLTKFNIFNNQSEIDLAVINMDDKFISRYISKIPAKINMFSLKEKTDAWKNRQTLQIKDISIPIDTLPVKGPHNEMNVLASVLAVYKYCFDKQEKLKAGLQSFKALAHRLEPVGIINGVRFINDSKATNTDSVKYALQSFSGRVHVILGGSDKGEDFSVLLPYLQNPQMFVYLIGATTDRMRAAFSGRIGFAECADLKDATHCAYDRSVPGDVILLSPACASYDSYKSYVHRGESFKEIVNELDTD